MADKRKDFPPRPAFFDNDDDYDEAPTTKPQTPPGAEGNPLWEVYRILPGLPFRIKVEQLLLLWDMDADDISKVLSEDFARVKDVVDTLNREWLQEGQGLTDEQKALARGKMIRELRRYRSELDALGSTQDAKIIQLKISISEKISKLQGLEIDRKKSGEGSEVATSLVDRVLTDMNITDKIALAERLKRKV